MGLFQVAAVGILTYAPLVTAFFTLYLVGVAVYRLYFHPLAKYPGPPLWRVTRLPSAYHFAIGRLPYKIAEFHDRYGPVVRISPNELNFNVEEAWLDIYGKPPSRNTQLPKDQDQFIANPNGPRGLLLEPDDDVHARHRRNLAPGFSEKILREQEPLITKYFDLLIQRLREKSDSPVNMVEYFEFATVDIISDLTFGESFDCLEKLEIHLSLQLLHRAGRAIAILGLMQKFYPLNKIFLAFFAHYARDEEMRFRTLIREKLLSRLELPDPRPDIVCYSQKRLNTKEGMMFDELTETGGLLIAAGSETTASLLSGVTYHRLTNRSILAKLTDEVRNAFKKESEITMISVNSLEYLLAVLNEALCIYPPVPGNLNRITPPEGCMVAGRFIPGNTYIAVNQWAASHSSANFKRLYDFIPERWMGAPEFKEDKRRVVNPFSVGPRNCIGRNLANVEMRVILARMVFNFDMELCEESRGWLGAMRMYLLFEGKPPLMVKLTPVAS
ncbi:cytochrome P450 [Leptodontidium sp. 2 PMI_412]|nr:cytochrome P450 [Leptodontidium sp. 2 PMI_412]